MKKLSTSILFIFCLNSIYAQLFSNQSEYFIKLTNGQALTYYIASATTTTATTTPAPAAPTNQKVIVTQSSVKLNNAIYNVKSSLDVKSDSLIHTAYNENDKKQIWIIEFVTPTSDIGTGNRNLNIALDYTDASAYFMIRNKENGKYLTWSVGAGNKWSIALSPLSKVKNDTKQHWAINTIDPALRGSAKLFLGRSSIFGFAPRFSTNDTQRPYITFAVDRDGKSGVAMLDELHAQLYNRGFNIEPAWKAEKIELREIETFCPKILLKGDRDFATGTQRDMFNRIIEEDHKMSMYIKTELVISQSKTEIWAKVYFSAEEIGGDGTKTEGSWQFKVYQTIQGRTLKEIVSPFAAYNTFDANMNEKNFKLFQKYTSDIINYYTIIGDTIGDDVSTDDNCGDDTRVERIKFNPIYVTYNN